MYHACVTLSRQPNPQRSTQCLEWADTRPRPPALDSMQAPLLTSASALLLAWLPQLLVFQVSLHLDMGRGQTPAHQTAGHHMPDWLETLHTCTQTHKPRTSLQRAAVPDTARHIHSLEATTQAYGTFIHLAKHNNGSTSTHASSTAAGCSSWQQLLRQLRQARQRQANSNGCCSSCTDERHRLPQAPQLLLPGIEGRLLLRA
jgi:hypothetical protein